MDMRFCNFRGTQYRVKYEIWGNCTDDNGRSLFTRYEIFQLGYSTFVIINALGPNLSVTHDTGEGNVRVWELTNINLLTDINYNLTRHGVNMHDRMIYNASVRIDDQNELSVRMWLSAGPNTRRLFNDTIWVSADEDNPGLMDNSVPQLRRPSGLFGNNM